MILNDCGSDITGDKINTLVKVAGIEMPEFYGKFFQSNFATIDIAEILKGGGPQDGAGAGGDGGADEDVVEEVVEEVVEKADIDFRGGMFGDEDSSSDDDDTSD